MHKWPHPLRGEGRSAKKWRYSISLFITKWLTRGREGISKNRWRHLWTAPEAMSSTDSCMAYIKDSLVNYWEGSSIAMEGILCRGTQHQRITTRASRSPPPPHFFSICCQNGYYHTTLLAYVHTRNVLSKPTQYMEGSGGIVVGLWLLNVCNWLWCDSSGILGFQINASLYLCILGRFLHE